MEGGLYFGGAEFSHIADYYNAVIAIYSEGSDCKLSLQSVWHRRYVGLEVQPLKSAWLLLNTLRWMYGSSQ